MINMAAREKGLFFLRETGPKKALKRIRIGKQRRKGCWKPRNLFYYVERRDNLI